MKEMRLSYPISLVSRALKVSSSGFYSWCCREPSTWAKEEARLEVEIRAAHSRTRETYGAERLQHELASHGVTVGVCRLKRIRRKLGLHCRQKRKFKATTDSAHKLPVAGNILKQQFKAYKPDSVWVSDITYVPTDEGWLYLAGHKDLFNSKIVGYAMGERLSRNLVSQSLMMAMEIRRPDKGLLHHSDRGSQYCNREYLSLLRRFGLKVSMSQKGNCFDNAPMESFWGILKQELIHHRHYRTRHEAMQDIAEYIEIFYNRQRLQERLGFLSPVAYEQRYYTGQLSPTTNHIQPRPSTVTRPEPAGQSSASDSSGKAPALDGPRAKATLSAASRLRIQSRVRPPHSGEDSFRVRY
jgi:putative transposase